MNDFLKKRTWVFICMLLLNQTCLAYLTDIQELVVDKVDTKSSTIVANGKEYTYKLNVAQSRYRFDQDFKKSIGLKDLVIGEKYFIQLKAEGENMRTRNFDTIIFIAKSKPSE